MNQINLQIRFNAELCTFAMAKKVKAAGLTCDNLFFAYDADGNRNDHHSFYIPSGDYFPCVNFPYAVGMLQKIDLSQVQCWEISGCYHITYNGHSISNKNIVDAILELWLYTLNGK